MLCALHLHNPVVCALAAADVSNILNILQHSPCFATFVYYSTC